MSAGGPAKATGAAEPAFAPAAPFELRSVLTHRFESCPAVCASAGWVSALSSPPGASKCLVWCLAGGRGKGSRVCSALCLACGSAGRSRARAGWLLACRLLALGTQRWSHHGRCFLAEPSGSSGCRAPMGAELLSLYAMPATLSLLLACFRGSLFSLLNVVLNQAELVVCSSPGVIGSHQSVPPRALRVSVNRTR